MTNPLLQPNTLFLIKVGDLLPVLGATVYKPDKTPQDLTGATVRLHVIKPDGTLLFNRPVSAIDNPTAGHVLYNWQAGDTDVAGRYTAEFEATIGGLDVTYPNDRNLVIYITAALA